MLKSNNFQHYKLSTLSFLNIKIPSFSFLKKAILGLYKNLFWHISRKIGKILENFQKVPFEALLKQQKIFSKSLMKMDRFPKKNFFFIEKSNCHNFWRFLSYQYQDLGGSYEKSTTGNLFLVIWRHEFCHSHIF